MRQQNDLENRRRIGILGGTFDPPHRGHVNVAINAVNSGIVDEVWIMVSPENPFKRDMERSPASERVEMCRVLLRSLRLEDKVKVSDFELSLPLPSYMINTLTALRREHAECDFRLIIGEDNLENFDKWRDSERIVREFGLIVYPRDNDSVLSGISSGCNSSRVSSAESDSKVKRYCSDYITDNCVILKDVPRFTVSSTYLRRIAAENNLSDNDELSQLTSPELARFIRNHHLYG